MKVEAIWTLDFLRCDNERFNSATLTRQATGGYSYT